MSREPALVMIMAGGTGGHIYPGLAVAASLRDAGARVRWLGAAGGMECVKVPEHGLDIDEVRISALRGKGLLSWLTVPYRLLRAVLDARRVLGRHRPDCAVSFGGYVAGPGGIAAWLKGIPLIVHEQNRIPGLTNRVLARLSRQVLQAFPESFPAATRARTCGNPVRASVVALEPPASRWQARGGSPRLLVTGGSQGARRLNRVLPEAIGAMPVEWHPEIRHQTGPADLDATRAGYRQAGVNAEVMPFIEDMAAAYAWADLVVCRAGALTISELAAAGLGAVLVPFPHAVDDHQTANAGFLADAGAAIVMQESCLSPESLAAALEPILADRSRSLQMADAARGQARPHAARQVAEACLKWVSA